MSTAPSLGQLGVHALVVGAGGFVGSALRFAVSAAVLRMAPAAAFPWATLAVNVTGCFVIGVVAGLADTRSIFGTETRLFLVTGLLGGFTTFSAFGHETLALFRDGDGGRAVMNVVLQVGLGLTAAAAGLWLTK